MQIPERLQCTPHLNSQKHSLAMDIDGPRLGTYRGFCLRGKPDGWGEWRGDGSLPTSSYCGEWKQGLPHGIGTQSVCYGERSRKLYGVKYNFQRGEFWRGSLLCEVFEYR
jgi:hypothetical protein